MGSGSGGGVEEQFFTEGSQVEVSSDQEGFQGAWYVATVVKPPSNPLSKKKKQRRKTTTCLSSKYLVEYQTLLANDDGSKPLREYVDVSFMRPLPPSDDHHHSLELNDVVDAFHRDGWWTGVITRVFDDSKFVVYFRNPPEEIEFARSELRGHREWVDCKWVRPEKLKTTGLIFSTGTAVEVSFDEENLRDAWFLAIVLREIGNNAFLVECQSSRIGDNAALSKVTVDSLHIRPSPPRLEDKDFGLLEKVDAFYNFGWWSGVITKFLKGGRYIVLFTHTNEEKKLSHSELRPHMDWIDGKWVIASQSGHICNNANKTEMAVGLGSSGAAKDNTVERTPCSLKSRENEVELLTPCDKKSSLHAMTSIKKKLKHVTPDSDAALSRPLKKLRGGNAAEAPLSLTPCQYMTTPIQILSKEAFSGFATPAMGGTGTDYSTQSVVGEQLSAKTEGPQGIKQQKVGGQIMNFTKKKGRTPKSRVKSRHTSATGKEDNAREVTAEEIVEKECIMEGVDMSGIIGLECKEIRGSQAENPRQLHNEVSLKLMRNDPEINNIKAISEPEGGVSYQTKKKTGRSPKLLVKRLIGSVEGEEHTRAGNATYQMVLEEEGKTKKKRGRPPTLLVKRPIGSVEGEDHNEAESAAYQMVVKDCATDEAELPAITGMGFSGMRVSLDKYPYQLPGKEYLNDLPRHNDVLSSIMKMHLAEKDKQPNEMIAQILLGKRLKKRSSKKRIRRSITMTSKSPVEDASRSRPSEVFEMDCVTKDVVVIDELPSNIFDDQPLLMWFEGMHSPTTVDDSRVSPSRIVNQSSEASNRQDENVMQSPAIAATGDSMSYKNRSLPFVKCSPLWETIESMEVFRVMPQKPHFCPLGNCKEDSREGLAIANMVTFASVVERTSKLQLGDPRSIIDRSLETLLDLEIHGFDVEAVRRRLNGLLSEKDRQGQRLDELKEVEKNIMEHNLEKTKIDAEIHEIHKKMMELQEKLAIATSMKEVKDYEITALQSKMDVICKDLWSAQLDFERLAASPW